MDNANYTVIGGSDLTHNWSLAKTADPNDIAVTGVTLNTHELNMASATDTAQLTAAVKPDNAVNKNVTWSSKDTDVAAVDNNGFVTAVASGTTLISVVTADGSYTDSCVVNVGEVVEKTFDLWLDRMSIVITNHEGTVQLTPTMTGADVTLNWSSSNDSVAKVDGNGIVTGLMTGTATITVEATYGENTVSATCDVIVLLSDTKTVKSISSIDNHRYLVTYSDGSSETIQIGNNYYGGGGTTIEQTVIYGKDGRDGKDGKDGVGIASIEKTGTIGNVDTYTITYTDGTTTTFTVTNGKDGVSPTITIGENGHWFINDVDTGKNAVVKDVTVWGFVGIGIPVVALIAAAIYLYVFKDPQA